MILNVREYFFLQAIQILKRVVVVILAEGIDFYFTFIGVLIRTVYLLFKVKINKSNEYFHL